MYSSALGKAEDDLAAAGAEAKDFDSAAMQFEQELEHASSGASDDLLERLQDDGTAQVWAEMTMSQAIAKILEMRRKAHKQFRANQLTVVDESNKQKVIASVAPMQTFVEQRTASTQ